MANGFSLHTEQKGKTPELGGLSVMTGMSLLVMTKSEGGFCVYTRWRDEAGGEGLKEDGGVGERGRDGEGQR